MKAGLALEGLQLPVFTSEEPTLWGSGVRYLWLQS